MSLINNKILVPSYRKLVESPATCDNESDSDEDHSTLSKEKSKGDEDFIAVRMIDSAEITIKHSATLEELKQAMLPFIKECNFTDQFKLFHRKNHVACEMIMPLDTDLRRCGLFNGSVVSYHCN